MSKYNRYAKDLDAAFRAARQEYENAWDKLQSAKDARSLSGGGAIDRQRAELKYQEAELAFKEAEARIWPEFNRRRAELRASLERDVRNGGLADPDAVDLNGMKLLESGTLSVDDYYSLAEKYDDNPTMLRFVAKYAKEAADDMDSTQAKDRGALYQLAQVCSQGQGRTMRAWDDLSHIADYCSGQARAKRGTPAHTISMGKWWEQLSGEAVENF
jgi:hypothetical protein